MSGGRVIRGVLIAVSAVLALAGIAVIAILLFVDFDALIAKHRDRALAAASEMIGRRVEAAEVETSWWPVGIEARGIAIEGLGHADALQVEVSVLEILKSFGKRIEVDSIVLVHPVVEITRDEQGRFSYEDIVEHMNRRPKAPMDPKTVEGLKRTRFDRIAIENGTLSFVDRAAPGGTGLFFVDDIDIALEEVKLGEPARITVDMGVLSEADNFELSGETGALPESPDQLKLPAISQADLRIQGVPLRSIRLWLPKDSTV